MAGTGLIWKNPPPDGRGGGTNHGVVAAELKAKPGVWAQLPHNYGSAGSAGAMAHYIRRGDSYAYKPAGSFEAKARTIKGEHVVFLRYVGEKK